MLFYRIFSLYYSYEIFIYRIACIHIFVDCIHYCHDFIIKQSNCRHRFSVPCFTVKTYIRRPREYRIPRIILERFKFVRLATRDLLMFAFASSRNIMLVRYFSENCSHLLSFPAGVATASSAGVGGAVRSSKLMMYKQMSSTSLFIGAITSLHRNFVPATDTPKNFRN